MTMCKTRYLLYLIAVTFTFAAAVFGWLQYDWIKHTVAWRPDSRVWQYLLPLAAGIALSIVARRNLTMLSHVRVRRTLRRVLLIGIMGACLAVAQWLFAPSSPWLLYTWMVLLGWAGWLISPDVRLNELSPKKTVAFVLVVTICMILMHVTMQLRMWHDLSFGYRDIGLFVRALHNAAQGQGLWVDTLHRSILEEHAFFALWILVPLCRIGADPFMMLVIVSSIMLNGSALIIYWYVRRRFASNVDALIAALSWLLLPWFGCLVVAHSYGFHLIYIAVPVLLIGLSLTELRRYRCAAVAMLMAMLVREDIVLTVAAWSVFLFFVKKRQLLALWVFGTSVAYFLIALYVIVPYYRGSPYPHIASYLLGNPGRQFTLQQLLLNLSFLFTLFIPLAGLPFRHWRLLCVATPALAETVFTTNSELHNICFQYYTPAIAVLFLTSIEAWRRSSAPVLCSAAESIVRTPASSNGRLSSADAISGRRSHPGLCLLTCALAGQVYLGLGPMSNNPASPYSSAGFRSERTRIAYVRNLISSDLSITASYRIASHFLDYRRLWSVQDAKLGDCVIIDDRDNWDAAQPRSALIRAHRLGDYRPLLADYHLVVLVKDDNLPCDLSSFMPTDIPADFEAMAYELGQGIEFVARRLTIGKHLSGGRRECRISIIWKAHDSIDGDYRFGLVLEKTGTRWGPFFFARGAYPTAIWSPERLYRDDIDIILPQKLLAELNAIRPVLLY